jgi:hypothetical protein
MRGLVVIKTAYLLNARPESALNNCRFPTMCMIRNEHKNKPVKAMINFWPMDELNILVNQFIVFYIN